VPAVLVLEVEWADPFGDQGLIERLESMEETDTVVDITPRFSWPGAVPAIEVISIYISLRAGSKAVDLIAGKMVEDILHVATSWARAALGKEGDHGTSRPKRIKIYGPEGNVVKSVLVRNPNNPPAAESRN
jgi:hypothetical protein